MAKEQTFYMALPRTEREKLRERQKLRVYREYTKNMTAININAQMDAESDYLAVENRILYRRLTKNDTEMLGIMLQILDDGRVTDSHGKVVSFENTVIVMTSNAGSDWKGSGIGFAESVAKQNKDKVYRALKNIFRPEFLNRIDEIVVFDELSQEEMTRIFDIMLGELSEMLEGKGISLSVSDEVRDIISKEAMGEHLGARPLRRLIGRKIEDKLADIIIAGSYKDKVMVSVKDGEIVCE